MYHCLRLMAVYLDKGKRIIRSHLYIKVIEELVLLYLFSKKEIKGRVLKPNVKTILFKLNNLEITKITNNKNNKRRSKQFYSSNRL